MPAYPTLTEKPDSQSMVERFLNPGVRSEYEGGYIVSRARYTRAPRKMFGFSYKALGNTDKIALENFYRTVKGSADSFTWTHPFALTTHTVRFTDTALEFHWAGHGQRALWDVSLELEEV